MPDNLAALSARLVQLLYEAFDKVRGAHAEHRGNIPLLTRLTAHLGIIALVIIALLMSGVGISAATPGQATALDTSGDLPPIQYDDVNGSDLTLAAVPFTIIPQQRPRTDVVQYTVAPKDTVTGIAARFHISPDSILWSNDQLSDNPDLLSVGQTLNIPPTSGVLYKVQKNDTIQGIAAVFKARPDDILNDPFNQSNQKFSADPPVLVIGSLLMVPGGQKAVVTPRVTYVSSAPKGAVHGTSSFSWPVAACVSQIFWARHSGIDLAAPIGTPVYAADSGFAEIVGWDNTGYGNMILLNHGNGYLTRYGHLSAFAIRAGQSVKKGQLIGRVGSTGHSTGPHLHFEVIFQGVPRNPAYIVSRRAPARCPGY